MWRGNVQNVGAEGGGGGEVANAAAWNSSAPLAAHQTAINVIKDPTVVDTPRELRAEAPQ